MTVKKTNFQDLLGREKLGTIYLLGAIEKTKGYSKLLSDLGLRVLRLGKSQAGGIEVIGPDHRSLTNLDFPPKGLSVDFFRDLESHFSDGSASKKLLLSVQSPWIIKKPILEMFGGLALNVHPAKLPDYRGGHPMSWEILMGEPDITVTIHQMTHKIDEGDVLLEVVAPAAEDVRFPADRFTELDRLTEIALRQFFETLIAGRPLPLTPQESKESAYFPRLFVPRNGWIDWSWPGLMVERFVRAFSSPFEGARTLFKDEELVIYNLIVEPSPQLNHPFALGVIIQKSNDHIKIVLQDALGVVRRQEISRFDELEIGDRLASPQDRLDNARIFRVT